MKVSAARRLVDPRDGSTSLGLRVFEGADGTVETGVLESAFGTWYPITGSVPRLLLPPHRGDDAAFAERYGLAMPETQVPDTGPAAEHRQTVDAFSDKWRQFQDYGIEEGHQAFLFDWYCKKLGLPDRAALAAFYGGFQHILECGPGSGFNTRFMGENCPGEVYALDISEAADTTHRNTAHLDNVTVVQADLMNAPFADGMFDFIIADGVLHHTPDTRAAVGALYRKLAPGGRFFFYVYRAMGPARVFCDEHIRARFTGLTPEQCYSACEGLTELGRELSRLNVSVTLDKGVDVLGIPAGTHDVQRLLYYHFVKCFWNEAFDFRTNNMVNYDWYHPHFAWQHTDDEVIGWLKALGVDDWSINDANPNGISVLLRKPG